MEQFGPADPRPRGIRNNNPGNVEFRRRDPWVGQAARETLPTGQPGRFAVFETPEHGIRAMAKLLMNYQDKQGLDTLEKITNRYAPPVENDPQRYAQFVGERAGLKPDEPFRFADDPERAKAILMAMILKENGSVPYPDERIRAGLDMAFQPPQQQAGVP
jgi:hypothetical protein